jgi:aryl-alcohol dehydrogenase-like predicted oxidoreductase
MKKSELGRTGLHVSPLGFGAAPVGYLGEDVSRTADILNTLLDAGMNLIDTAACYPNSEQLIGKAVGHRRGEFILVSKCGHQAGSLTEPEWSSKLIGDSVDRSLRHLKTDCIDVMLLHSCEESILRKGEALSALSRAREAGKIRFVGYSGDNQEAAYAATFDEIAVIETSVSICDQANIDTVLPVTQEREVGVLVKRPIANACWKNLSDQRGIYQGYAEPYARRFAEMNLSLSELDFEETSGSSWAETALRFTLSIPGVHCALIGTTNPRNAAANLAAAELGPLSAEIVEKIRTSFKEAQVRSGHDWPGLT